jgi:hypothetical protein
MEPTPATPVPVERAATAAAPDAASAGDEPPPREPETILPGRRWFPERIDPLPPGTTRGGRSRA